MKNLELNDEHVSLGGKMIPFAGFNMPVQYEGVNAEHSTVRNAVGVFDVSHMGEFLLTGPKALDLIQYVCSNDASKLEDGQIVSMPLEDMAPFLDREDFLSNMIIKPWKNKDS